MVNENKRRLVVRFGEWAWDRLPGGRTEVELDHFKPAPASVAESVEAMVRRQIAGGENREIRVEPTGWSPNNYTGTVIVAGTDGGYERCSYVVDATPVPEPLPEPREPDLVKQPE